MIQMKLLVDLAANMFQNQKLVQMRNSDHHHIIADSVRQFQFNE